jgi:hypothetical protein
MPDDLSTLDLSRADDVAAIFRAGAASCRSALCRVGSIDHIRAPGRLIATGDLHDNPFHLRTLIEAAGLGGGSHEVPKAQSHDSGNAEAELAPTLTTLPLGHSVTSPSHLLLHEIIHGDRLMNGMDFSYRALARVAWLKSHHPEHVHVLLANHELSQVMGAGIIKDGVQVVKAFDEALDFAFADQDGGAAHVREAIKEFIFALPLALRASTPRGDILCAHSVPGAPMMARFDPTILSRDLTPEDYEPRRGSAYWMVWGREYDADQIEDLVERWGVNMFILGHEKAEHGVRFVPPCALVLNSDHDEGVYLPIDLSSPPRAEEAARQVVGFNPR